MLQGRGVCSTAERGSVRCPRGARGWCALVSRATAEQEELSLTGVLGREQPKGGIRARGGGCFVVLGVWAD